MTKPLPFPPIDLPGLAQALDDAAFHVTADGRDWAANEADAWVYGILIGWSDTDLAAAATRWGWPAAAVAQLRRQRAAVAAFPAGRNALVRPPHLEIHYTDGAWAGLYVDGTLTQVGDAHVAEEMAFGLAGVIVVKDDAFMRGQIHRDGVARTLDEVAMYRKVRDHRRARVVELRQRAAELEAQARELETGKDDG